MKDKKGRKESVIMIFADNCDLFAASKEETRKMIGDTKEDLRKKGLDWKEDQMELMASGFEEEVGDVLLDNGDGRYKIKDVNALQGMGAMITQEADPMSAMSFRMSNADKASWADMKFYKNGGIAEGRKHRGYREVVQSCVLHSRESWSWNKDMVDTLHGWESRNLGNHAHKKVDQNEG